MMFLTKKRIWLWLAVIAVCGMIFAFSSQNAEASHDVSIRYAEPLAQWIRQLFPDNTAVQTQEMIDLVEHYVRKAGHFSEYALLGFLTLLLMDDYRLRGKAAAALGFSAFYAATDELHQLLSDGRSAMWQDVVLDSAGAAAGILLALLILHYRRKKNV